MEKVQAPPTKKKTLKKVSNGVSRKETASVYTNQRYFFPMNEGTVLEGIRQKLFLDRYSMKDETGEPMEKFPEQSWKRVSKALAQVEKTPELQKQWEKKFYEAMLDSKFCPAGRFLVSAGTGTTATMINCYVIPDPEDTRAGIIKTLAQVTELSARGGGVGFNLSSLRPRGAYLRSINGTSSGAVSWANLYSVAAHDVIQQGGSRRGALMIMLWDWHPDVEEFITVKKEQGKILGANLSVCISDAFMEAVKKDKDWQLKFPDTEAPQYETEWKGDLEDWEEKGYPVKVHKTIKAQDLWNLICESAWASAEPGIIFMELANKMNNTWYFEKNICTNPCGEQHLPAWGVCNLSSLNLAAFVEDEEFDYEHFSEMVRVGVRFLDNAINSEKYLYKEIEEVQERERRIGLGTVGLADALIKMKIRYGSAESLVVIEKIFKTLRDVSYQYSVELAKEKGAFPMFDAEKYLQSGFMKTMPEDIRDNIRKNGIRNALVLTEAPTGKISLLAGVNSGIEPVFSFSYIQKDRLGERTMYHPLYQKWVDEHGTDNIPEYFVVADDLTPDEHVQIQALIQKYTDSSISKTVNAPRTHSIEDVKKLYELAYETGCKGISYMREGSREGTLIRAKDEKPKEDEKAPTVEPVWSRPMKVHGFTYRLKTPVGTAFITINHDEYNAPVEVFINIGHTGSDIQALAEALGRVISKSLRLGNNLTTRERAIIMIEQLKDIGSSRSVGFGPGKISSLPDAVAKALAMDMGLVAHDETGITHTKAHANGNGTAHETPSNSIPSQLPLVAEALTSSQHKADICPDCGNASLVNEMGCQTCYGCGYSAC
jgi:ribonucleoside-diphosphate reductase alpha chain